jgi:uncharacterized protein (TIGR02284 family)
MTTDQEVIDVLNDLILINRDRITGYEKAAMELKDTNSDLHTLFNSFASQSAKLAAALIEKINTLGGKVAEGTTNSGKVYRAWMDVKTVIAGNDRLAILNSCEFGEDAAQRAYENALNKENKLTSDVEKLIAIQKAELKQSHDEVKMLRDNLTTTHAAHS